MISITPHGAPFPLLSLNLLYLLIAYGMGSICTAIPVCQLLGLADPRTQGSGNPGATNVLRIGGKIPALLTLIGDLLKSVIPMVTARLMHTSPIWMALIGFAAFLGHLFPVYYHFQGGKGVATAFGVLWALHPLLGLSVSLTWLLVFKLTHTSSIAALTAFALMPVFGWVIVPQPLWVLIAITLLIFLRHRLNILALLHGKERVFNSQRHDQK